MGEGRRIAGAVIARNQGGVHRRRVRREAILRLLLTLSLPWGGKASGAEAGVALVPLGRLKMAGLSASWGPAVVRSAVKTNEVFQPVFRAATQTAWPTGWVPIFAVEVDGRIQLRRTPLKGRENFTDPLFFALPPDDEPTAAALAGRWNLISRNQDGHQHRLAMELTVVEDRIVGRLDQNTDYRFAFLTGGTWRTNRLEVNIEYINDRYRLSGGEFGGRLIGEWQQVPEGSSGTWEATRAPAAELSRTAGSPVPLYEWRRGTDAALDYRPGTESPGEGWKRADLPLCRVWPP